MDHSSECGLSKDLGKLYLSKTYSDVSFLIENESIPAHKSILAARSDYFHKLLFGGMQETNQKEIKISEIPIKGFKMVLKYFYTDHLDLSSAAVEDIIEMLSVANLYQIACLEKKLSKHLCKILTVQNASIIFNAVLLYNLQDAIKYCRSFICRNAEMIIKEESFCQLTLTSLYDLLDQDSFYASEISIFRAVYRWCEDNREIFNQDENFTQLDVVLKCVRLSIISAKDLINTVKSISFITNDVIVRVIDQRINMDPCNLPYRGEILPYIDVVMTIQKEANYVWCCELKGLYIINCIIPYLGGISYGNCLIQTSVDKKCWVNVYESKHSGRLPIYINQRVMKFIKITVNTVSLGYNESNIKIQAKYMMNVTATHSGYIQPTRNVATLVDGAKILEGTNLLGNSLLAYNAAISEDDYTRHTIGNGSILIQLKETYMLDSMRMELWDHESWRYTFTIESSLNRTNWELVVNEDIPCTSWQVVKFALRPILYIKITGTSGCTNNEFRMVYFECPAQR